MKEGIQGACLHNGSFLSNVDSEYNTVKFFLHFAFYLE
jgi:hypothetical protein